MRIVFMGSPAFGLPTLRALLEAGHEVSLVVTRPDSAAGRGRRLRPPPAANFAEERGLPLYQPASLRERAAAEPLRRASPEVIVVAAFGMLLPPAVLELAPGGCLNVHPSLLPRWRGAAPIQAAIVAGDREAGVTVIKLVMELDAGPILAQERIEIALDEDALALEARLAALGARLLVECLVPWRSGRLTARPQREEEATYCTRLTPSDAELRWGEPADRLARVVRAFRGRTDAFTYWERRLLRVLATDAIACVGSPTEPGVVFLPDPAPRPRRPLVTTGRGALLLREVAIEGRPAMPAEAFLNGHPAFLGARLGASSPDVRAS